MVYYYHSTVYKNQIWNEIMKNVIVKSLLVVTFASVSSMASATTCITSAVPVGNASGALTTQNVQDIENMKAGLNNKGVTEESAIVSGPSFSGARNVAANMRANDIATTIPVTVSGPGVSTAVNASTNNHYQVRFRYHTQGDALCFSSLDGATVGTIGVSGAAIALGLLAVGAIAAAAGGGGGGGTTGSSLTTGLPL